MTRLISARTKTSRASAARTYNDEPRIGLTPETVKKLVKAGAKVKIRSGAGLRSHFADKDYQEAGAEIAGSDADAVAGADIVLTVRRPSPDIVKSMKKGAVVIGMLDPFSDAEGLDRARQDRASRCSPWS